MAVPFGSFTVPDTGATAVIDATCTSMPSSGSSCCEPPAGSSWADVISIGEMRDFETIKIALTAAETGCLVLSTLHIMSIDKIIERLLSFVATEDEGHIRYVLADTLVGVIHQELVPARDGGKRVASEILIVNQATKHIIRNRGTFFLRNVITTGKKFGMVSMQNSLQNLVDEGSITPETMNDVMANYR